MNLSQIEEIASGLAEREAAVSAARRESERAANERAQRESVEAARAQRDEIQRRMAHLEVETHNAHERCLVLEQQYRELPDRIAVERRHLNILLSQLNDARKGLQP